MEKRFYYKDENGNKYSFKSEHKDLIPITEEEFNAKPQISEEVKARFEKHKQIAELKSKLANTDYIANKLSEAQVIYIVTGENTKLLEVFNQYKDILSQREEWRNQINELEKSGN